MTAFDPDEAFSGLPGRPVATSVPVDFATLELLPYGVIVVDSAGVILFYNRREERISGLLRGEVMGRNFFTEVAPCTAVQAFHGRFLKLMEHGIENVDFQFVFPLAQGRTGCSPPCSPPRASAAPAWAWPACTRRSAATAAPSRCSPRPAGAPGSVSNCR